MESAFRILQSAVLRGPARLAAALLVVSLAVVISGAPGARADVGSQQAVGGIFAINGMMSTGATLSAPIGTTDTTINISDMSRLAVGEIVNIDLSTSFEIMQLNGLSGDGPGGVQDTMTVTRGIMGTSAHTHAAGAALFANGIPVQVNASSVAALPTGSTLQSALDTQEYEATSSTLSSSITSAQTQINVSSSEPFTTGRKAKIDNEKMSITSVVPGYLATLTGATTVASLPVTQRDIKISDITPLTVGAAIRVDGEDMTITALSGDGPGGAQDVMTVTRPGPVDHPTSGLYVYTATSAATLYTIDNSQTVIPISDKNQLAAGWVVLVDNEPMTVNSLAGDGPGGVDDTMTVTRTAPVAHTTAPVVIYQRTSATTQEVVYAVQRTVQISDKNMVHAGWNVRIEMEIMNVTAVSGDGPGGAIDTMTVTRSAPADHLTYPLDIYGGQDKLNVTRGVDGTTAAAHNAGAVISQNIRTLSVTSHANLGQAMTIQVDSEKMSVEDVVPGYSLNSGATLTADAQPTDTTISVSNTALLQVGWVIRVDSEAMKITGLAGGAPGTATVQRAQEGSSAVLHLSGHLIYGGQDKIKVDRGILGSTIAAHAAGAAVSDVDGLGSYQFNLSWNTTYLAAGTFVNESFLTSTGRSLYGCFPSWTANTVTVHCETTGGLPLGATGSGLLATVYLRAVAMTNTTLTPLDLVSGQLIDTNGHQLSSTVTDGSAKVVKCADENGDKVINFNDALIVAKAAAGQIPPLPKHDVDSNGHVLFSDALLVAKLAALSPAVRCPPNSV